MFSYAKNELKMTVEFTQSQSAILCNNIIVTIIYDYTINSRRKKLFTIISVDNIYGHAIIIIIRTHRTITIVYVGENPSIGSLVRRILKKRKSILSTHVYTKS